MDLVMGMASGTSVPGVGSLGRDPARRAMPMTVMAMYGEGATPARRAIPPASLGPDVPPSEARYHRDHQDPGTKLAAPTPAFPDPPAPETGLIAALLHPEPAAHTDAPGSLSVPSPDLDPGPMTEDCAAKARRTPSFHSGQVPFANELARFRASLFPNAAASQASDAATQPAAPQTPTPSVAASPELLATTSFESPYLGGQASNDVDDGPDTVELPAVDDHSLPNHWRWALFAVLCLLLLLLGLNIGRKFGTPVTVTTVAPAQTVTTIVTPAGEKPESPSTAPMTSASAPASGVPSAKSVAPGSPDATISPRQPSPTAVTSPASNTTTTSSAPVSIPAVFEQNQTDETNR
ncbi:hypothetical protein HMPREF1531_00956 [Propionibacterium sp. oral taxon 192 str. F0372]|nr:hypothetical protein HMPREF1531_00956 [Propionibacterium sp. oral taxon 192 str. F0372]